MDSNFKILYAMVAIFFTMLSINTSNITIIANKNVDYRCIAYKFSKSDAINLFENSVLENC